MNARTLSALVLAALLLGPGFAAAKVVLRAEYVVETGYETGETNRMLLDAAGQRNCLDAPASLEAAARPGCAFGPTGEAYPAVGIRVLDAILYGAGLSDPVGDARAILADPRANASAAANDAKRGMNPHRASGGVAPDLILPGRGQLWAWHGRWNDLDGDGAIDIATIPLGPRPRNEWSPDRQAPIVAYVEPGSHPSFTNFHRPDEVSPDMYLVWNDDEFAHHSGGDAGIRVSGNIEAAVPYSVLLTGSLFEVVTLSTVTDAILAPSAGGKPYTPRETSLVDVDRYAAAAPGPVAGLYAGALASTLRPFTTPSLGYCPNACRPGPVSFADTPLEGPGNALVGAPFAPYPQEWRPGSLSTNAGRHVEYLAGYEDWIDLHPRWSPLGGGTATRSSPLPGRGADGAMAMMPGVFSAEVRLGLWHDLDGDGFVGTAREGDPYHGGSRPVADDYTNPRGEFFGANAVYKGSSSAALSFAVDLFPETTWGNGVWPLDINGRPLNVVTGAEPIRIAVARDENVPGYYSAWTTVLMPEGSPAFTVCTDAVEMLRSIGAGEERLVLRDCDRVAAWDVDATLAQTS
ncbi:MAG TPA: hypothetical protein VM889_03505 [Candidatus Thermoplasmatota archaeon]|nr:hypothetical protein [Candidatus Thermoplasmatota archaeon]